MSTIKLNEILQLNDLKNVKIRFNLMFRDNWNPIDVFRSQEMTTLLEGQYWNYKRNKSYKVNQINIGFIKIKNSDHFWLLFHIGKIIKDLNVFNGVGYEYETISEYEKYFGRLIIRYRNTTQNMIRFADTVIDDCEVSQILPDIFDNDLFPGYDKVSIIWSDLSRVLEKDTWKTALQNQKGVYLLTDTSNGKMYVGSAYGEEMILTRWRNYIKNGHGNNVELKGLKFEHVKKYFKFSILDIFKSTTDTATIIERENWWKETLQTRKFGYNKN